MDDGKDNLGAWVVGGLVIAGGAAAAYHFWWKPRQQTTTTTTTTTPTEPGATLPKPQPVPTVGDQSTLGPGVHTVGLDEIVYLRPTGPAGPWNNPGAWGSQGAPWVKWWPEGWDNVLSAVPGQDVLYTEALGGQVLSVRIRKPGVFEVGRRRDADTFERWLLATPGQEAALERAFAAPSPDAVAGSPPPSTGEPSAQSESTNIARHGVTLNPASRELIVTSYPTWRAWAAELLAGLNLEAWTARQLFDRVWRETFPELPEEISEAGGYTVNGTPYAETIARGEDLRTRLNAGTLFKPRNWSPFDTLGQVMVGSGWTPYERGQDFASARKGAEAYFIQDYVFAIVPRRIQPGGAGQGVTVWDWYVWAPTQALLSFTTAVEKGAGVPKKADAIKAAVTAAAEHRKGNV